MNNVKTPCVFPSSLRNKTSQTSWSPPSCPTPRGGRCALVLATPKHGLVLGHKDLTLNRHSLLPVFKLYKWSRRHMFFYNFFFYHCICNTLPCWHVSSAWIPFYKHPKLFMCSVQRPSDCSQHSPNTPNNATVDAATHHARACLPELPGVRACGEHSGWATGRKCPQLCWRLHTALWFMLPPNVL